MATNPDTRVRLQTALAEDAALELGIEAYIYGYPLVLADVTKRVMTLGADSVVCARAPLNRFAHLRALPGHNFTDVVSPNADTLFSSAWLSLAREPVILSLPEMGQRYFVMMLMDGWSNVLASPGTRTIGAHGWHFAMIGPRWKGTLPAGVSAIEAPTNLVWIIGRTETNGPDDDAAAHAAQDQYALTPLHAWGRPPQAPPLAPHQLGVDTTTPPAQQVSRMEVRTFFSRLNYLMRDNPPALADAPMLARFSAIGVGPGEPFELFDFSPSTVEALERSTKAGQAVLVAESQMPAADRVNGWHCLPAHTGAFGTDYTCRAAVALTAFGANVPADCTYAHATVDSTNETLTGRHRYEIRFPHGQLPPVNAFWSISLYNTRHAVIANPLDRHAIGSRDPLVVGPDGSTTLYIQRDPPLGERARNWLPAPEGPFNLVARLYWPRPEILGGVWRLPAVARIG